MNFIFNDNVRILCLSCNVKNVGKLVRFKQKGQKQVCCIFILQSVHLLYIYAIRINFCFIRTRRINFSAYEYIFLVPCSYVQRRAQTKLFRPVSQRVQINFIFNDNVRILCLSCNVKKVGKLVRFKQ
jgi:hypothetical protein